LRVTAERNALISDLPPVEVTMDAVRPLIPYLIPILVLELGLMIFALLDLSRRKGLSHPKWAWVLLIVLVQPFGAILYITVGRKD
jgi:hypothetical protein